MMRGYAHAYGLGSKLTFQTAGELEAEQLHRFLCGNVLNVKSKISAFQNTKNLWKWLIIEEDTTDFVSDFHDEK